MLAVAVPKRNKLQNIIVLTPKDGAIMEGMDQKFGVQNYENGVEFWFTLDRK